MIRHFATEGNLKKRYIGITDEPLCETGRLMARNMTYPPVDMVYASPLIRCLETAELIYPKYSPMVWDGFRECDFGDFENKNYLELSQNPDYQAWVDSNGTLTFPNGEKLQDFKKRCLASFQQVVQDSLEKGFERIALVVHGGTIMSILEWYAYPQKEYYEWQVKNGEGFTAVLEEKEWRLVDICAIH